LAEGKKKNKKNFSGVSTEKKKETPFTPWSRVELARRRVGGGTILRLFSPLALREKSPFRNGGSSKTEKGKGTIFDPLLLSQAEEKKGKRGKKALGLVGSGDTRMKRARFRIIERGKKEKKKGAAEFTQKAMF